MLADTIHNFGDASTAIPLWIAFACARLRPTRRFPYGLGRVEDLAGAAIVLTSILDLTAEEAGRMLGIKASTIRVLSSRARAHMKDEVDPR